MSNPLAADHRPATAFALTAFAALLAGPVATRAAEPAPLPSLVGTWTGKTDTIGDLFGLRTRPRTVHITEQTDRRFRGYFTYEGGRIDFFGIVYPDDVSFTWVSPQSRGYVHGRLLAADRLAACYAESGAEATAGCSDLTRTSATPQREPKPDVAKPPVVTPWPKS